MPFAAEIAATHKALANLDLAIIGVYFLIVFGIGFYFSRRERTSEEYFLAGRDVGWFFIGASLFVSNISTEHFYRAFWQRCVVRPSGRPFRMARVFDITDSGLGVRTVLFAQQRFHYAPVFGAAV